MLSNRWITRFLTKAHRLTWAACLLIGGVYFFSGLILFYPRPHPYYGTINSSAIVPQNASRAKQVERSHESASEAKLLAVTIVTHSERYFPQLRESARRHGVELVVVGAGESFYYHGAKTKIYGDYLRSVPPDTVCLLLDAYDSLVLTNGDEILAKFLATGHRVIVSGEADHRSWRSRQGHNLVYPYQIPEPGQPPHPGALHNVCAGLFIGYASSLLALMDKVFAKHGVAGDDQSILGEIGAHDMNAFAIDYKQELFANMVGSSRLSKSSNTVEMPGFRLDPQNNNRVQSARTGHYPCVLHKLERGNFNTLLVQLQYNLTGQSFVDSKAGVLGVAMWVYKRIRYLIVAERYLGVVYVVADMGAKVVFVLAMSLTLLKCIMLYM